MTDDVLRLAGEAGLLVDWRDAAGEPKSVTVDNLRRVLTAMGLPAETSAEISESRARLSKRHRAADDLIVRAGSVAELPLKDPSKIARVSYEGGGSDDVALAESHEGVRFVAPDRIGYHRLELGGLELGLTVTPSRAFTVQDAAPGKQLWGTAVQLYALRDDRPEPFGDFGSLGRFAEQAGASGADAIAISPIHALFLADSHRYSPYSPSTRLFLNGLYADPECVFGPTSRGTPGEDLIDWPTSGAVKRERLWTSFCSFQLDLGSARRHDFEAFSRVGGDELRRHAVFEALQGHFFAEAGHGGWPDWPTPYQNPDSPSVQAFAAAHSEQVQFHTFVQWLADRSLASAQKSARDAGMSVGLIADLAVGMDGGGSHAWSRREEILAGLNVGAPPDLYQPLGQDWGVAAFSPEGLRQSGYRAFVATLRSALTHAGGMRIDHAMGLRRLWMVPKGASAADGAYLSYPFEELMGLIALESQRARAIVVAEDLGTVPEGFRERLYGAGVLGMSVLWFERHQTAFTAPADWERQSVAMTSTHDLPTVSGWWRERDIDWRLKLAPPISPQDEADRRAERDLDRRRIWDACVASKTAAGDPPSSDQPQAFVDAAVGLVAATPAPLTIVPIEDLLGLDEQVNLPGDVEQHPNWRRRLPVGDLFARPDVQRRSALLNRRSAP